MSPSVLWRRSTHRLVHLLLAAGLGVFVYSLLRIDPTTVLAVQVVVFPLLVVSGLLLWNGRKLRRWLGERK